MTTPPRPDNATASVATAPGEVGASKLPAAVPDCNPGGDVPKLPAAVPGTESELPSAVPGRYPGGDVPELPSAVPGHRPELPSAVPSPLDPNDFADDTSPLPRRTLNLDAVSSAEKQPPLELRPMADILRLQALKTQEMKDFEKSMSQEARQSMVDNWLETADRASVKSLLARASERLMSMSPSPVKARCMKGCLVEFRCTCVCIYIIHIIYIRYVYI